MAHPAREPELADLCDANFVGAWSIMADLIPGGWTAHSSGIHIAATGIALAPFNLVFVLGPQRDPERALARAMERLDARHLPYIIRIRSDLGAEVDAARALGLAEAGDLPGMVLPDLERLPSPPAGLRIERVRDASTAADHLRIAADAFNLPEEATAPLVSEPMWSGDGFELYVGYVDDAPAATSALCVTGTSAGIYNVAVPTRRRRRGLGAALTAHAARRGADAYGARAATLQASDMGVPVYERMGFRTVCHYRGFAAP